jgi:hypothetical protein
MHRLEIKDNKVSLDGKKIECVKQFNVKSSAKEKNIVELTLIMEVSTVRV